MDVLLPRVLWMAAVAAVFLAVNTALAAAALKVNAGQRPLELSLREVVLRSFLAALGVTAYDVAALLLAPLCTPMFALLAGGMNSNPLVLYGFAVVALGALPAVFYYNWAFGLDDHLEALKVYLIHRGLPLILLLLCLFSVIPAAAVARLVTP
jgi:hypothetical protein